MYRPRHQQYHLGPEKVATHEGSRARLRHNKPLNLRIRTPEHLLKLRVQLHPLRRSSCATWAMLWPILIRIGCARTRREKARTGLQFSILAFNGSWTWNWSIIFHTKASSVAFDSAMTESTWPRVAIGPRKYSM